MLMRNITLPTGPYDWHPERVPVMVTRRRRAQLAEIMTRHGLDGLVVTGSTFDDGAIAWATGFTPKLGAGFAVVPREGDPRLLFSGGPGMTPSARKLTWIDTVAALRGIRLDITETVPAPQRWGLCADAGLSARDRRALPADLHDVTDDVTRARGLIEPECRPLVDAGIVALARVESTLLQSGPRTRWAARLDAERALFDAGGQDLRLRLSRMPHGAAEPVDPGDDAVPAEARIAMALRVEGYWHRVWTATGAAPQDLHACFDELLQHVAEGATPAQIATEVGRPCTIACVGHGLADADWPADAPLVAGLVVTITLQGDDTRLSLVAEVTDAAPHLLWRAAPLAV